MFEFKIALRFLLQRHHPFLSVITLISVLGITLGIISCIVVLAISSGFQDEFREKIMGLYPHLVVLKKGENFGEYRELIKNISKVKGVTGVTPATYDEMMISSKKGRAGALIKGIEISSVENVLPLKKEIIAGNINDLIYKGEEIPPIFLGSELGKKLRVNIGEKITLISPLRGIGGGEVGPFGMAPTAKDYIVQGFFESGFYDHDSRFALIDITAAQKFLQKGDVIRWIEVKGDDPFKVEENESKIKSAIMPYTIFDFLSSAVEHLDSLRKIVKGEVSQVGKDSDIVEKGAESIGILRMRDLTMGRVENYKLIDWKEMNKNIFSALKLQKVVLGLFFMIIVLVASFIITGTQMMILHERISEISILLAMGLRRAGIKKIFLIHGSLIGIIGIIGGILLGILAVFLIKTYEYELNPQVYLIKNLPAKLNFSDVSLVVLFSLLFILSASFYSAVRAGRKTPVDGIRKIE